MKILVITNEIRSVCGVTSHLKTILDIYQEEGIDFRVLCGGGNKVEIFKPIYQNITQKSFLLHQNRSVVNFTVSLLYLLGIIVSFRPDIVHVHQHYSAYIVKLISKIIPSVRLLQSNHGIIPDVTRLPTLSGHYFIALHEGIRVDMISKGINVNKIFIVRHGFKTPDNTSKPQSPITVICASRFVKEKGIDLYLKAVEKLSNEIKSQATFYLAGDGEEKSKLLDYIKTNAMEVNYLGALDDLLPILKKTHIFIFPNQSATEGIPMVLIEAGLTKNLIISSDYFGSNEVIEPNKTGFVFKVGQIEDLVKYLSLAIQEYNNYKVIIDNMFDFVKVNYSYDKFKHDLLEVYSVIIQQKQ